MKVTHSKGAYEIDFVGSNEVGSALPPQSFIITDSNVESIFQDVVSQRPTLVLPAGESEKNLERFQQIVGWLAAQGATRSSVVVALGGGVIGDIAGFAAAAYMRGVALLQIPTTLLAQVDSSVGGKVGVDLPQGKNLVGAFHPPNRVLICVESLKTLDSRQFTSGMAEVWKYGFIGDVSLVKRLSGTALDPIHPELEEVVKACIDHKRRIVEKDEFETTGLRATLNFGHTVGHALEQITRYKEFLHGEAISIGMVAESHLGEKLGTTKPGTTQLVRDCLIKEGLPVYSELLRDTGTLIEVMKRDKKAGVGHLAFSLLTQIGACKLVEGVPFNDVKSALNEL